MNDVPGKPLASVLINNFNNAPFLARAIDSALAQTYEPLEIVVADDASVDASREIIAGYRDRITAVYSDENRGQGAAINAGFEASHGDVLFLLDGDDEFQPEKVARVMEIYARHPRIGSCFHQVEVRTNGRRTLADPLRPAGEGDYRPGLVRGQLPTVTTPMAGCTFRRDVFAAVLPMPDYPGIGVCDIYLKSAALSLGPTYFLNEPLAVQRLHGANRYSGRSDKRLRALVRLWTAHTLRGRFPQTARIADPMLQRTVAALRRYGGLDHESRALVREYLSWLPPRERRALRLRLLVDRLPAPLRATIHGVRRLAAPT